MRHRSCVRTGNSQAASAQRTSASDIQLAISACPHMVHKHNSAHGVHGRRNLISHGVHGRRNLISKNTEGVGFLQLYMAKEWTTMEPNSEIKHKLVRVSEGSLFNAKLGI